MSHLIPLRCRRNKYTATPAARQSPYKHPLRGTYGMYLASPPPPAQHHQAAFIGALEPSIDDEWTLAALAGELRHRTATRERWHANTQPLADGHGPVRSPQAVPHGSLAASATPLRNGLQSLPCTFCCWAAASLYMAAVSRLVAALYLFVLSSVPAAVLVPWLATQYLCEPGKRGGAGRQRYVVIGTRGGQ